MLKSERKLKKDYRRDRRDVIRNVRSLNPHRQFVALPMKRGFTGQFGYLGKRSGLTVWIKV